MRGYYFSCDRHSRGLGVVTEGFPKKGNGDSQVRRLEEEPSDDGWDGI